MITKRKLIICSTLYQIIVAIRLRETIFKNDIVSIVLTDHANQMEMVARNLKAVGLFDKVFFVKVKNYNANNLTIMGKIGLIKDIVFGNKMFENLINDDYDEIVYYNYNYLPLTLFSRAKKVSWSRFEEGVLSYDNPLCVWKPIILADNIRKTLHLKTLASENNYYYCFYPELYRGNLEPIQIPKIDNDKSFHNVIIESFNLNINQLNYKQKYIYFTSVYDFEGGDPINEFELVVKIRNLVGQENLLVKLHPRDERGIYEKAGFNIDKNSDYPWEVIQLAYDFSNKIFLTATSGSVLAGSLMTSSPVKTFFLYHLCSITNNVLAKKTAAQIDKLVNSSVSLPNQLDNIIIADNIEDILWCASKRT